MRGQDKFYHCLITMYTGLSLVNYNVYWPIIGQLQYKLVYHWSITMYTGPSLVNYNAYWPIIGQLQCVLAYLQSITMYTGLSLVNYNVIQCKLMTPRKSKTFCGIDVLPHLHRQIPFSIDLGESIFYFWATLHLPSNITLSQF